MRQCSADVHEPGGSSGTAGHCGMYAPRAPVSGHIAAWRTACRASLRGAAVRCTAAACAGPARRWWPRDGAGRRCPAEGTLRPRVPESARLHARVRDPARPAVRAVLPARNRRFRRSSRARGPLAPAGAPVTTPANRACAPSHGGTILACPWRRDRQDVLRRATTRLPGPREGRVTAIPSWDAIPAGHGNVLRLLPVGSARKGPTGVPCPAC
jgi:hypothetical protein